MPARVRSSEGLGVVLHRASYTYELHCNTTPRDWRDRLGRWLRGWAELVDGRRTLAIRIESDPPLPIAVHTDVLRKGLEHMARLLKDAVADECTERLLKKSQPHVFDA